MCMPICIHIEFKFRKDFNHTWRIDKTHGHAWHYPYALWLVQQYDTRGHFY